MSGSRVATKAFAILGSVVGLFGALMEPALADTQYDTGINPALSASGSTLVEVHQAGDGVGPLWFRTGQVVGQGGNVSVKWDGSQRYDTGVNPAVAVSGSVAIEVHQATSGVGPLWYRLGVFYYFAGADRYFLIWGPSHQYDTGVNPSVAISGSRVVEVHEAGSSAGALWYRTAQVQLSNSGPIITWHTSIQYDTGAHPAVSLWPNPDDASGSTSNLAEVHQAGDGVGQLLYRGGTVHDAYSIADGGYISWPPGIYSSHYLCGGPGLNHQYDIGIRPAIAVSFAQAHSLGHVELVEYHLGMDGVGPFFADEASILPSGVFDQNGICGVGSQQTGVHPAIALPTDQGNVNVYLVEVHQGQTGVGPLWYSIGPVPP